MSEPSKSVEEMEKQISWIYLNFSYPAAKVVITKELYNWKKDIQKEQAENDAEVARLVLKAT